MKMGVLSAIARACGNAVRAITPSFLCEGDKDESGDRSRNGQREWREEFGSLPGNSNFPHITERNTMYGDNPEPSHQSFQFFNQSPRYSGSFQYDSPTQTDKMIQSFDSGFDEHGCQGKSSPFGREGTARANQRTPQRECLNIEREKPRSSYTGGKKHVKADMFDGESRDLEEYLAHFGKVSSWNGWSYEEKGEQLAMCLRGTAHIATLHMSDPNDYEAIVSVLAHRFSPKEDIASRRSEFRNRKRGKAESIGEYGYALRNLANRAYRKIDPEAQEIFLLEQFIGGLCNSELQQHIQFRRPETLNDAMSIAREYEAIRGVGDKWRKPDARDQRVPVRRVGEERDDRKTRDQHRNRDSHEKENGGKVDEDLRETIKELQQTVQALVEEKKKREIEKPKVVRGTCYICGDESHFANRCPQKGNNWGNRNGDHNPVRQTRSFTPSGRGQLNH